MNDSTPPPIPPPLSQGPPPPPAEKQFTLSKPIIVVCLLYLGLIIYVAFARNLNAESFAQLAGRFTGTVVVSLLFSWIAWRLARRSDWVKSAVFILIFLVSTADLFSGRSFRRSRTPNDPLEALQQQVRRVHEEQ